MWYCQLDKEQSLQTKPLRYKDFPRSTSHSNSLSYHQCSVPFLLEVPGVDQSTDLNMSGVGGGQREVDIEHLVGGDGEVAVCKVNAIQKHRLEIVANRQGLCKDLTGEKYRFINLGEICNIIIKKFMKNLLA